jgi:hypothetical protein
MQERVLPRGWIERRTVERRCDADTQIRILGAALCAYGKPSAFALDQRGLLVALDLRVLTKLNRTRTERSRKSAPIK